MARLPRNGCAAAPRATFYAWCDAACTATSGWAAVQLLPEFADERLLDLVLDASDRPRVVFETSDAGPGYAWCDEGCEGRAGVWDARLLIEDRAVLEALHPVPVPTDCNESRWMSGYLPKLALTPDGDPRAVFVAQRVTSGHGADGRTCDGRTDVISARISLFPQPRSSDP